ncbi:SagB family peptide dehydrogenase [Streptomyces sp. NPDC048419]|uniref:SagB/ThcOx family dehydrogenase n=1 Tax=Streptomyces sp. NPDC048419 TaxID=3365547 RepID=UPI0037104054
MSTLNQPRQPALTIGTMLRQGVGLQQQDSAVLLSLGERVGFRLHKVPDGILKVLKHLADQPVPTAELDTGLNARETQQLARVLECIAPLLATSLMLEGQDLMSMEATAPIRPYEPADVEPETPVRLSKFAFLRRREGGMVLESPCAAHRCVLKAPPAATVVTALARTCTAASLASPALPEPVAAELLGHLVGAGFADVGRITESGVIFPEDEDEALRQWDFHDLLFHSRSRFGRTDEPFGGRFPYVGKIEPLPVLKPAPAGEGIELYRPHLEDLLTTDAGLLTVMENRQSIRHYGDQPVSLTQLGEFLYRVARVKSTYGPRPDQGMPYEASTRPYPCGGAAYELELYLTIRRCEGLEPGIYHYDPHGHRLRLINSDRAAQQEMLDFASTSTGGIAVPDMLITITSRFQRLAWKYQSIAYAVTLKHVGVLYQTMYLVATAMGLAPCGLGSGSSEAAERAFHLDPLRESSVGEFLLGSVPSTRPTPHNEGDWADWRPVNDPQWQQETRHLLPWQQLPSPGDL